MGSLLAVTGFVQLFASAAFLYTANAVTVRSFRGEDIAAARAFIAWWVGMSFYMGASGLIAILASFSWHPLGMLLVARLVYIPAITVAAAGLVYYVAYLYTGRRALKYVVWAYYALAGAAYMALAYSAGGTHVQVTDWSVEVVPRIPNIDAIFALFGVPAIVAAVAYLTLAFRPLQPIQRYRVTLVATSILAWVVSGIVSQALRDPFLIFLGITFFGIVTSFTVFLAYRPPSFIRARLASRKT